MTSKYHINRGSYARKLLAGRGGQSLSSWVGLFEFFYPEDAGAFQFYSARGGGGKKKGECEISGRGKRDEGLRTGEVIFWVKLKGS